MNVCCASFEASNQKNLTAFTSLCLLGFLHSLSLSLYIYLQMGDSAEMSLFELDPVNKVYGSTRS